MKIRRVLLIAGGALAAALLHADIPVPSALSGQVTSVEEGPMEGVVVSAKKDGSTISISVVSNAAGALRVSGHAARTRTLHIESARGRV